MKCAHWEGSEDWRVHSQIFDQLLNEVVLKPSHDALMTERGLYFYLCSQQIDV